MIRYGYKPCWKAKVFPDNSTRHCRKPKGHSDDCTYF